MSVICDMCKQEIDGESYTFVGTIVKKGGKRTHKVELKDVCSKCVSVLSGSIGLTLPGNFGKKRGRRKQKDVESLPKTEEPKASVRLKVPSKEQSKPEPPVSNSMVPPPAPIVDR